MVGPTTYQTVYAYVRADDTRFDDGNMDRINDPQYTIPVIDGDVTEIMVRNRFPKAKTDRLPQIASVSEMFLSVMTKKSDVLFLDKSFFDKFEKTSPGVLKVIKTPDPVFVYAGHYSFSIGEQQLKTMVEIAIRRIIDDGRMKALAHKYSDGYFIPLKNFEDTK